MFTIDWLNFQGGTIFEKRGNLDRQRYSSSMDVRPAVDPCDLCIITGWMIQPEIDIILEPAPQGMGAPPATGNTQGNDVEAHRSLSVGIQVSAQCPPHACYNGVCPLLHHLISPGWGSSTRCSSPETCLA